MGLESHFNYGHNPASEREDVFSSPEEEYSLLAEQQAKHPHNWTEVLKERVSSPETRQKFLALKERFPTTEKMTSDTELDTFAKFTDVPPDTHKHVQDNYWSNIDKMFNSTKYGPAHTFNKSPHNLGVSQGYGDEGAVFIDGKMNEKLLTNKQKEVIEAHEKLHGLFMNLTQEEKKYILSPFDLQKISAKHRAKADEILARMSQLKNYFGFLGGEEFTLEHLKYAKKHYIEDVGLDNSISNMFNSIEDVKLFLEVINTVAC